MESYLHAKMEAVHQAGGKGRWTFGSGMPAEQIITKAHEHQVSLVVMTTQGRGGLGHWRLGRVTEEIIRSGRLSVLVVPSSAPSARVAPGVLEVIDSSHLSFQQQEVQP